MAADSKSSARLTCTLTLTELSQELGEGGGGEVVGLVRIATKVIQGFIYLKLNYLSSGAPNMGRPGDFPSVENTAKYPLDVPGLFHFTQMNSIPVNVWKAFG